MTLAAKGSSRAPQGEDVTVNPPAAVAATSAVTASIAVGTRMLLHWSDIAIEQEREACAARRGLERAQAEGGSLELGRELRPSLIAIAASSHALDALFGEIRGFALPLQLQERWKQRENRPPRPRQIHEALKHGFRISAQRWAEDLRVLFDLRDGAVHPETVMGEPKRHPLGANTAPEYLVYSCEKATEAVNLLFEILETCATEPKPALQQWASDLRPSVERLREQRAKGPLGG
jgi:hypothetical protein